MKKPLFRYDERVVLGILLAVGGNALVLVVILSAIFLVAGMDQEDAEIEERIYCENVLDRVWPDYKGIYGQICKKYENGQAR